MIHGLIGIKSADWRQDPEGVAGEENDVIRMSGNAGNFCIRDVFDRIGSARILCNAGIIIVYSAAVRIIYDIFQNRSEVYGPVNFRLLLLTEVDSFGVAASFYIDDTLI